MPQKAKYPVCRKFTIDTGGTNDVYVDIGQCLSLINHRLYRQGRLYRCRVSITQPTSTSIHAITTLPDTWWARRAYNKVRDLWMTRVANKKALGVEAIGRWNDFKIGYDAAHRSNFTSALKPMLVTDATGTQAAMASSNEEWNLSELMDNDGNANTFRFISTTVTSNVVNVLDAYSDIQNIFAPDPDESGSGANIYSDFHDGISDEGTMDDQGDNPPYHETDFPQMEVLSGQLISTADMGSPTNGQGIQRLSTGYFDAPLGLLRITPGANEELTIEVQAGDYKGVEAPAWE